MKFAQSLTKNIFNRTVHLKQSSEIDWMYIQLQSDAYLEVFTKKDSNSETLHKPTNQVKGLYNLKGCQISTEAKGEGRRLLACRAKFFKV